MSYEHSMSDDEINEALEIAERHIQEDILSETADADSTAVDCRGADPGYRELEPDNRGSDRSPPRRASQRQRFFIFPTRAAIHFHQLWV